MAESWLVEGIKFFGGIAGLGTALSTIWDRLFRDRPLVSIYGNNTTRRPEPELSLRVKNVADEYIVVRTFYVSRPEVKVYPDRTLRSVISVALEDERFAIVEPKSERSFVPFDHGGLLGARNTFRKVEVEWSKTGNRLLGGRVTKRTTNRELAHILTDAIALREKERG